MIVINNFGVKIRNYEASTIFENNNGVRDRCEFKDAMLTNSLFKDYLESIGLKVSKQSQVTKDIICLEFNFGSRSYEEEIKHLDKQIKKETTLLKKSTTNHEEELIKIRQERIETFASLKETANINKDKYVKLSTDDIRKMYYNNGVTIAYPEWKKNGEIKNLKKIHYKMLFRSTGKAKKGSCMFICDRLYSKAKKYLYMGLKMPEVNPKIVEASAYIPLVSSTIVDRIKINPKNILILEDIDSWFRTNVVSVETDSNRHCIAKRLDSYDLKNTIFDGQALIDSSIFPSWGNGYILLRHHFCKMAAFCSNIQQFFKDYFGEEYQTATVKDMFGVEHFVKDIELITTDNAMKWLKFDVSYDYWCDRVFENGCLFGIVKTAHKSKLGDVQRMSYQMVNALDQDIMKNVVKTTLDYIDLLKTDDDAFLEYLDRNATFSNDYDVLAALVRQNNDFLRCDYFRDRKSQIIYTYVKSMKSGKLIQNADNLTIVGSPYAMLLYAATADKTIIDKDDTFDVEEGTIQCYTERFDNDTYLAEFRSPFNSKNNLGYLHNVYHPKMKKYFTFGTEVIAVNMIHTDFQDRNNGSDMDSDSIYVTDHPNIVKHSKYCYHNYPTIVNNIPMEKNVYENTMDDYARIDNNLASASLAIGESSNLAQIAQTYTYNFDDSKYDDYVCILSVLAQVAIDNAKRRYDIDLVDEIQLIKDDMDIDEHGYPKFWSLIQPKFNRKRINKTLSCPMNYLYDLKIKKYKSNDTTLPLSHFFQKFPLEKNRKTCKKVEELIEKYSFDLFQYNTRDDIDDTDKDYFLLRYDFEEMLDDIESVYISKNYIGLMSWLIDRAFLATPSVKSNKSGLKSTLSKNRSLLIKVLYRVNPNCLLKCFAKNM